MTNPQLPNGLSEVAYRELMRYQNDLQYFCARALKIKHKEGGEVPFVWNKAQQYLHSRIEEQLARKGFVRLYIIKGRQQGISTYIAARLYHRATRKKQQNIFILSHHSTTTSTLFQIVEKYHNSCPENLKPKAITNNNRKMEFENSSQYTVGTAGVGAIGRGDTNQCLHWSEVAFSENTDQLATGVVQTVADVQGTEIFKESTANGVGNYFHRGCMDALEGKGDYEIVFIPWYWQDEYRAPLREDFELTTEESDLKSMYGLDDNQIQWRRNKIQALKAAGFGELKFKQEYPFTIAEAFQSSGSKLIDPEAVAKARKTTIEDPNAPLVLGVDPGPIHDRTAIAWRQGRKLLKVETFLGIGQMVLADKLARRIEKHNVAKVFIDVAEGRGCVDRLHELGFRDIVSGIPFSMSPTDEEVYVNKRAEMAGDLKDWIEDPLGVDIPDDEELGLEIGVIPEFKTTSNGKRQLIAKDEIKKTLGKSPDLFDAFMLTFAQRVRSNYNATNRVRKANKSTRSELSASNRRNRVSDDTDWDDEGGIRRANKPFRSRR